MIPLGDVADLQAAFAANPQDLGVGLYNPATGEIRLGSFDTTTQGQGHQGLASALGITNNADWRGFLRTDRKITSRFEATPPHRLREVIFRPVLISSDGKFSPTSHFNLVDGALTMRPDLEAMVRQELIQTGLIS